MAQGTADIGLIGLAVMGQNLVLNLDDHGYTVAVFNRTVSKVDEFVAHEAKGTRVIGTHSLEELVGRYDAVNVKLDKTGGLTEALLVARQARALGLEVMVGSMVATSLAMAPALLVAQDADFVDLDGPLLLERDREPGLTYEGGMVLPPSPALWG